METKHTKGPWTMQQYVTHTGFSIWAEDRGCIAERWYDKDQPQPYSDELLANAKLIAAAPDLLAVLKGWFDTKTTQDRCDWVKRASETIAKAEGK